MSSRVWEARKNKSRGSGGAFAIDNCSQGGSAVEKLMGFANLLCYICLRFDGCFKVVVVVVVV